MKTLKEALMERHSVRQYQDKKIESEKCELLRQKVEELNKEGNLHLQFAEDAGNTFNRLLNKFMGLGSASGVIACIGEESDDLDERVGYYGQKLVLYAQQLGLNTCWAGTYQPKNVPAEIGKGEKLVLVIAIGYGETQGHERKSKTFEDVVVSKRTDYPEWFKEGVKCALLAPTAINQQKFKITLHDDDSVEFENLGGIHSLVDLGIVKCNFEIGAERNI